MPGKTICTAILCGATWISSACSDDAPAHSDSGVDCSDSLSPGPSLMRRLSATEYANTASMLLGIDTSMANLPQDPEVNGFSNQSAALTMNTSQVESYQRLAEDFAARAFADPNVAMQLLPCAIGSQADDPCLREFAADFARLAFRRAASEEEVQALIALANTEIDATSPYERPALIVEAALQSPHFLFRVEKGIPDAVQRKLSGYEVASRLSFLLWQSGPDDALLDAAEENLLESAEQVADRARLMLDDPRARIGFREFSSQWLDLDQILEHQLSALVFPDFDPRVRSAMYQEVVQLIDDHIWDDAADLLGIYDAPYGYGDEALANLYGETGGEGQELARLDFANSPDRGGLFTTAGFLMSNSKSTRSSSLYRGKYVREKALCQDLPPPPPDVPLLMPAEGETEVESSQRHADDPACSGCHQLMDPIGWGLDRYAADGSRRTMTANGSPPRLEGSIVGFEQGDFAGGVELGRLIAQSAEAQRCAVQQVFRWSFARSEVQGSDDVCLLDQLTLHFANAGNNLPELLVALVQTDAFRYLEAAQ